MQERTRRFAVIGLLYLFVSCVLVLILVMLLSQPVLVMRSLSQSHFILPTGRCVARWLAARGRVMERAFDRCALSSWPSRVPAATHS